MNHNSVPSGWRRIRLIDQCYFDRGIEPGFKNYNDEWRGHKFLRVADLSGTQTKIVFTEVKTDKVVTKQDILLSLDGSIGIVKKGFEGIYSSGIRKVGFHKKNMFSDDLLYFILQTQEVQNIIELYASGTTIKHAGKSLKHITVLIPQSIEEQKKIASILDTVDTTIRETAKLISKLRMILQGLMHYLFTNGVDKNAKLKDSKTRWLGRIPEHWKVTRLGSISSITKLTGFEYTNYWKTDSEGEIIALRGFNIGFNELELADVEKIPSSLSNFLLRSKLSKGDIVFPCTGTIGNAAIIQEDNKYHVNQNVAKISAREGFCPEYIVFFLLSDKTKSQIRYQNTSGMQPVVLIENIRRFLMPFPVDIQEQRKIASILEKIHNQIKLEQMFMKKLTKIRRGLMNDLLTGIVRVKVRF